MGYVLKSGLFAVDALAFAAIGLAPRRRSPPLREHGASFAPRADPGALTCHRTGAGIGRRERGDDAQKSGLQ